MVAIRHRDQSRQLGNNTDRRKLALARIMNIQGIMVKSGSCPDASSQDRHWMRIARKTLKEGTLLFMHHRMMRDKIFEPLLLLRIGKFAFEQQIADFRKIALRCELLNRITAI